MAAKQGITVRAVYCMVDQFDMIVIVDGNDQAAIVSLLATNALGKIRSQMMRACSVDETKDITAVMPCWFADLRNRVTGVQSEITQWRH